MRLFALAAVALATVCLLLVSATTAAPICCPGQSCYLYAVPAPPILAPLPRVPVWTARPRPFLGGYALRLRYLPVVTVQANPPNQ